MSAERYTDFPLSGTINMSLLATLDDGVVIGVACGLLEQNGVLQTKIPYIQPRCAACASELPQLLTIPIQYFLIKQLTRHALCSI